MFIISLLKLLIWANFVYCCSRNSGLQSKDNIIYSDDPSISYVGRFSSDGTGSSSCRHFGWPGTQIKVRFQGSWIKASLKGSSGSLGAGRGDAFLVIVESHSLNQSTSNITSRIEVKSSSFQEYVLADGLSPEQEHRLTLWKVTEEEALFSVLRHSPSAGFSYFKSDGEFTSPNTQQNKKRKLEFIGDSDTAGYCADGKPDDLDPRMRATENTFATWAVQVAQYFDADLMIEAVSGYTVMGKTGMINFWRRTLPAFKTSETNPEWDFSSWVPDAVILLIGPNDFAMGHHPDTREFINAYKALMEDIVDAYTTNSLSSSQLQSIPLMPKIIHVCGGSGNGFDPCEAIQIANNEFNKDRTDGFEGFYTSMTNETWEKINNDVEFLGCHSHYNREGHAKLAEETREQIAMIMGW